MAGWSGGLAVVVVGAGLLVGGAVVVAVDAEEVGEEVVGEVVVGEEAVGDEVAGGAGFVFRRSHTRMTPSSLPAASVLPSGLYASAK